jgi:hypothetical protein
MLGYFLSLVDGHNERTGSLWKSFLSIDTSLLTPNVEAQGFAAPFARTHSKDSAHIACSAETLRAVEKDARSINGSINVLTVPYKT